MHVPSDNGMSRIALPVVRDSLRGAYATPTPSGLVLTRLPTLALNQAAFDPWVGIAASQASGARLEMVSDATVLHFVLRFTLFQFEWSEAPTPASVVIVTEDGHEVSDRFDVGSVRTYVPGRIDEMEVGIPIDLVVTLPASRGPRRITVWLPHMAGVEILDARANRAVAAAPAEQKRWIHYGSSISHGNGALASHRTWPAIVSQRLGLDLTNLGLAGQAHLDQFVARTIRDAQADVISVKTGINVVGSASMTRRVFESAVHGFLDTVRDGHPHTPLLLISPIYCGAHERAPGPTHYVDGIAREKVGNGLPDGEQPTLECVRAILARVVRERSSTDPHLVYVDGLTLLSADDGHLLPDGLHPNDAGFEIIAERFASELGAQGLDA